ncbi:MAG: DegT/DnrJ/EryC1/StrS family aminotransferase, partial [Candidatus Eremiobacteraeota bacterium]|nr:DegT/DnrJ/EryC1/StrS family aminotransferase [Candidatus Eremiobacteraeota bacterium]
MPYLRRMDAARTYANHGALATEFEDRLAAQIGAEGARFSAASNGTIAIVGAILASAGRSRPERPLAIIPGLTFVATAIAASQCGYEPYFVDVDADSWLLQPEALLGSDVLSRTGVVIPVAAFGRPVAQRAWQSFSEFTRIPVVIDAAAGFEQLESAPSSFVGPLPVALSLHATKSFAIGEGGGILTTDDGLTARVRQALNFGFHGSRLSETASVNGKLSEIHACVGLAELDGWPQKRAALDGVAALYRIAARECDLNEDVIVWPAISRCYALVRTLSAEMTEAVRVALDGDGIETRTWYG